MVPIITIPITNELEDMHRRTDWFAGRLPAYVDFDAHRHFDGEEHYDGDGVTFAVPIDEANLITSLSPEAIDVEDPFEEGDGVEVMHMPVIDIDVPCRLVESTTPGHFHLYIDKGISWDAYVVLLMAMEEAGIIETGYLSASLDRGYTAVRPPWVKKDPEPVKQEIPAHLLASGWPRSWDDDDEVPA